MHSLSKTGNCSSLQVFVSYLTSAANDICKEAKRQTISAEDVFTALQDLDFGELVPPTKDALEGVAAPGTAEATFWIRDQEQQGLLQHSIPDWEVINS